MEFKFHQPAMLYEVLRELNLSDDGVYLDLTIGLGGHSQEILKKIPNGFLIGFDKDDFAIKNTLQKLNSISSQFKLVNHDFANFDAILDSLKISKVNGILADLGVSSPQIDNAHRGFSYRKDGPLDMRMNQSQIFSALDIVNEWSVDDIIIILRQNADVRFAPQIAKAVVKSRPIKTTFQLVEIIKNAIPAKYYWNKNVSRQVFQAIRIAVNNEFESLRELVAKAPQFLKLNGKLCIITFHSIENLIVRKAFQSLVVNKTGKLPIINKQEWKFKSYLPTKDEIAANKRSRSAKLWVLTRISN